MKVETKELGEHLERSAGYVTTLARLKELRIGVSETKAQSSGNGGDQGRGSLRSARRNYRHHPGARPAPERDREDLKRHRCVLEEAVEQEFRRQGAEGSRGKGHGEAGRVQGEAGEA